MNVALQQEIIDKFAEYVSEEKTDHVVDWDMPRIYAIAQRPDLFARLMEEDKDFKKIECIVIPVSDSSADISAKKRQLAYLRPNCKIISIDQNTDSEIIVLPAKFGKYVDRPTDIKKGPKSKSADNTIAT